MGTLNGHSRKRATFLKNAIHNLKQLETAPESDREYIIKDAIIGIHHSTETLLSI